MVLMGVIAWVPFALPSLRMAGLTTWPWIYTILPFWAPQKMCQRDFHEAMNVRGLSISIPPCDCRCKTYRSVSDRRSAVCRWCEDAKDEMEKAVVEHGRELDTLSYLGKVSHTTRKLLFPVVPALWVIEDALRCF